MARHDDLALEGALRSLGAAVDWPTATPAGPDIAARVRVRLTDPDRRPTTRPWWQGSWWPARRSLVLAIVALLALAIVAGAVGLGLPGLRLILGGGPPPPTPAPAVAPTVAAGATPRSTPTTPREPGSSLGLGKLVELDQVEALTGIPVRLPADPRLGAPHAVYVDVSKNNEVAYVWRSSADLPDTLEPGIGLILMRFDGTTDPGFYEKMIGSGTHLENVDVNGNDGFWITGDPHFFFYVRDGQQYFDENRRWVGDALIWSDGTTTFRIESALGRDETIKIAESIE